MTLEVTVTVEDRRWRQGHGDIARTCRRAAAQAWGAIGGEETAELGVVLADDDRLRALNARYRHQDKPTNVLAFEGGAPPPGLPRPLGDVILAYQTVAREARDQTKTLAAHTSHLVVHGVLHLLGHDHDRAERAAAMESLEIEILATLGIADPYRDVVTDQAAEGAR